MKQLKLIKTLILLLLVKAGFASESRCFIPNQGQWNNPAHFRAYIDHGHVWVVDDGLVFNRWTEELAEHMHSRSTMPYKGQAHALKLEFKGATLKNPKLLDKTDFYINFFLGKDKSKWKSRVHGYQVILYEDIYPNVDLRLIATDEGFKYDVIAEDIADLDQVEMVYHGANGLTLEKNQLKIETILGTLQEKIPAAWLEGRNQTKESIRVNYVLNDSTVRFKLPFGIKRNYKVVVDPVLVFSTFSGSTADNFGCTATYDEDGNAYSGGTVFGIGFPVTIGAYDVTFNFGVTEPVQSYGGGRDVGLLKFSPDGSRLLFATYLGGENNEQPHSMVADADGSLYIMGSTASFTFPMENSYDATHNGNYDFFIAHLSADGATLLGSTYVGGSHIDGLLAFRDGSAHADSYHLLYNYADEFRGEIILHGDQVLVCGTTYSIDFPRVGGPSNFNGLQDATVMSLSKGLDNLDWTRVLGGLGADAFYGLAMGQNNDLFLSGGTSSNDLDSRYPIFQNSYKGGITDGILFKLDVRNGNLVKAIHLGTLGYDQAYFVQTDNNGRPWIYGQTDGNMPVVNPSLNYGQKGQFISRFDKDLTTIEINTNVGGQTTIPNLSPSAFLVDECERIFISGWGGSTNSALDFPTTKTNRNRGNTVGLPVSIDAVQPTTDGSDFYVAVFSQEMSSLLYGTFFGGKPRFTSDADEHVDGGTSRFDKRGVIYQAVCGGCGRNGQFPTTANAYSRTMNSNNCNNAVFKIDFENLNRKPFMNDTFIKVIATNNILADLKISDPDYFDKLDVKYRYIQRGGAINADTPFIRITNELSFPPGGIMRPSRFRLDWNTTCANISTDTTIIEVTIIDLGCPSQDTHTAYLKFLVEPPPIVIPPESVCLNFDRATNRLVITWDPTNPNMQYFKQMDLRMDLPNGTTQTLFSALDANGGTHSLVMPTDPFTEDYCFYMVGINVCDVETFPSVKFCTIRELNKPIDGVSMKFVTVERDHHVRIEWAVSDEPDFKEYEIYRSKRDLPKGFELIARTSDTFLIDSSFDVDVASYCYAVVVTDVCGHASEKTPVQCNIVLTGNEEGNPNFLFNLNWQRYINWDDEVRDYHLEYRNDIETWRPGNTTTELLTQNVTDNYVWGGYYFRVTATENSNAVDQFKSESNWIYMIHQPEMWVPSGMSPNGDGTNDLWGVTPVYAKSFHMRVFNRWGEKVWETTDRTNQWNGQTAKEKAEDRVYAWYLTFTGWDDKEYKMTGTVTLIH